MYGWMGNLIYYLCLLGDVIREVYEVLKSRQPDVIGVFTATKNSKVRIVTLSQLMGCVLMKFVSDFYLLSLWSFCPTSPESGLLATLSFAPMTTNEISLMFPTSFICSWRTHPFWSLAYRTIKTWCKYPPTHVLKGYICFMQIKLIGVTGGPTSPCPNHRSPLRKHLTQVRLSLPTSFALNILDLPLIQAL